MRATKHAKARLFSRMGIEHAFADAYAEFVFKDGKIAAEVDQYWKEQQEKDYSKMFVLHGGWVYVFGLTKNTERDPVLITVLPKHK